MQNVWRTLNTLGRGKDKRPLFLSFPYCPLGPLGNKLPNLINDHGQKVIGDGKVVGPIGIGPML